MAEFLIHEKDTEPWEDKYRPERNQDKIEVEITLLLVRAFIEQRSARQSSGGEKSSMVSPSYIANVSTKPTYQARNAY